MPTGHRQIFQDPRGRRWRLVRRVGGAILFVAGLAFSLFLLTLLMVPALPSLSAAGVGGHIVRTVSDKRVAIASLKKELATVGPIAKSGPPGRIVVGFYTPWAPTSIESFRTHAHSLTHVMPQWLHLTDRGTFDSSPASLRDAANAELIQIARENGVKIVPILDNAENEKFLPRRVSQLLADPARLNALAKSVALWLQQHHFDGINLDLEDLDSEDSVRMGKVMAAFRREFEPKGLIVTCDIQPEDRDLPLKEMAEHCAFLIPMLYDRHSEDTEPGPLAPIDWSDEWVLKLVDDVPPSKLVLGLGNYGYDWPKPAKGKVTTSVAFHEAMSLASGYREEDDRPSDVIGFDAKSLNSHFAYDDENNIAHQVWLLDAPSAYNQWLLPRKLGFAGAALWSLGSEDPAIWHFFDRQKIAVTARPDFADVRIDQSVDTVGAGEVLKVASVPSVGRRSIEFDSGTGLIEDVVYESLPSGYILRKSGYKPKQLVLTFDDGPDAEWTPQVLEVLARFKVPATFFVVGANAEAHPGLVRQIVREGHEIGSHTFTHPNMGAVSDRRAELELNATQRAIESITGRSTLLFRPPFNADSTPSTGEQLRPVLLADRLHYLTVGENIDPNDWDLEKLTGAAKTDQIVRDTLRQVHEQRGNVILLHDAGGDRSATVEALTRLIPQLEHEGYTFTTTAGLINLSKDAVMPVLPAQQQFLSAIDTAVFSTIWRTEAFLKFAFLLAIGLGLSRCAIVLLLAPWHRTRVVQPAFMGTVAVVVAAYNEERVITRTIQSVLNSDYGHLEVLVVDDGSQDGTADVVEQAFADDPRVRLFRKPNGGKASALNYALEHTEAEVFVGVDADTQLAPDAIPLLTAPFSDPKLGAIAGNVRVGNEDGVLTMWQSVEYTTAQNLDRRAMSVLGAVTVIPGAIGAWRRSAVQSVGGYQTDTLAEDMDLTWRLRRAGYRLDTQNSALAFTEAPDTLSGFFKQRFRWTYGTLQCLWKHRRALGTCGWFGWFALPSLWLFQIVFMVLAPLVDLQVLWSLVGFGLAWTAAPTAKELSPLPQATQNLMVVLVCYAVFYLAELLAGAIAFRWERRPLAPLGWLVIQRFVYRQIMYGVVFKSLYTAAHGLGSGWNKLHRKGTVRAR